MASQDEIDESHIAEEPGQAQRQRSSVSFPYSDLRQSIELCKVIYKNVALGECTDDQLAGWISQSHKSSGFRVQVYSARMFGLIKGDGAKNRLTEEGQDIIDDGQAIQFRKAKIDAFLKVHLYRAVFDKFKGKLLPDDKALESEMVRIGVAEKQAPRARQVFQRSAEYAGFFETGPNRLVMPGIPVNAPPPPREEPNAESEMPVSPLAQMPGPILNIDPLLLELLKKIPQQGDKWPKDQRVRWFRTFAMNVSQVYDAEEAIDIEIKPIERVTDINER